MTQVERKHAERLLVAKNLNASDLAFLKRVCWQNSVFVMAQDLGEKPHDLNRHIKGVLKLKEGDELVEKILNKLFLKLTQRPRIVVDQN